MMNLFKGDRSVMRRQVSGSTFGTIMLGHRNSALTPHVLGVGEDAPVHQLIHLLPQLPLHLSGQGLRVDLLIWSWPRGKVDAI